MTIAILCPTRSRVAQCRRMIDSVNATSKDAYVVCAFTPEERDEYSFASGFIMPDNLPTCAKWNYLADKVMATHPNVKLFMLGADDMYFGTPGWDKALLDHYNALENKIHVYSLQDSRDYNGTPHVVVSREYIERMGYFVPPVFLHWFVDSWTVEIAKANNVFTHFRDYWLVHDKPSDWGEQDETFSRIRSWGWRERDAYVAEKMTHILETEKEKLKCKIGNL